MEKLIIHTFAIERPNEIESNDMSVENLLNGRYFFVPRFQRPYSWDEENVSQFWLDLVLNKDSEYFIGSMVVYQNGDNKFGIVDGQQRLTTIMILLGKLRDAFRSLKEKDKAKGIQGFIERNDRENKSTYILETESSFPFFQENILSWVEPQIDIEPGPEERALETASLHFDKRISEYLKGFDQTSGLKGRELRDLQVKELVKIRDVVLDLNIILVELTNEDDAYLIFETLNTRGKDLALSDLLKNHFTRSLKNKGDVDHAKIKWSEVLDTLGGAPNDLPADTFIVHSWQSRYDFVTKAKAYSRLKAEITKGNAKKHLGDFLNDAFYYRSIFDTSFGWGKDEQKACESLEAFKMFKLTQQTPAILALVRAYKSKQIKLKKLISALQAIEKFHFAFTAVTSSRSSGGISGMYSSFGRKLFEAKTPNEAGSEIRVLLRKLRDRMPAGSEFDANFEQILYAKGATSQRALVRYILEAYVKHEKLPTVGPSSDLTVEHLLPQSKIGKAWPLEVVGQIGNLILVDPETNLKLGEKDFSDKKKILLENGYSLPKIFEDAEELTPELIHNHTLGIANISREFIWRI